MVLTEPPCEGRFEAKVALDDLEVFKAAADKGAGNLVLAVVVDKDALEKGNGAIAGQVEATEEVEAGPDLVVGIEFADRFEGVDLVPTTLEAGRLTARLEVVEGEFVQKNVGLFIGVTQKAAAVDHVGVILVGHLGADHLKSLVREVGVAREEKADILASC